MQSEVREEEEAVSKPLVVSAALRSPNGTVWTGVNHAECYEQSLREWRSGLRDGFLDADGQFLDREQAYDRAVECGQITADDGPRCLISEVMPWCPNPFEKKP